MMASYWLSNRLKGRKGLIIAGGALGIPVLWLAGQARTPWTLAALSAAWCFGAGMSIALVNTLAGLSASDGARGKIFGLLSLNAGLGTLFGGLAMGPIAEGWGYPALFACLSLFGLLWPVAALTLQDSKTQAAIGRDTQVTRQSTGLGRDFYCLLMASVAVTLAAYVFIVGRSLVMADLGYGAADISSTSALSEAPLLPLPLLLGRLSDRFGRKRFLVLGYLTATAGLLGLTASASPLHFWMNSVLVTVSFITGAVGTALVTDLVPRDALGKALSLFGAATGIAGIMGCAGAGCAIQLLGPVSTFVAAALCRWSRSPSCSPFVRPARNRARRRCMRKKHHLPSRCRSGRKRFQLSAERCSVGCLRLPARTRHKASFSGDSIAMTLTPALPSPLAGPPVQTGCFPLRNSSRCCPTPLSEATGFSVCPPPDRSSMTKGASPGCF